MTFNHLSRKMGVEDLIYSKLAEEFKIIYTFICGKMVS